MILDLLVKNKPVVSEKSKVVSGKSTVVSGKRKDRLVSFIKGISWRIIGTIDTIIISYFITGQWKFALSIGSVEVFTKIILFYFHDRAWAYFTDQS